MIVNAYEVISVQWIQAAGAWCQTGLRVDAGVGGSRNSSAGPLGSVLAKLGKRVTQVYACVPRENRLCASVLAQRENTQNAVAEVC